MATRTDIGLLHPNTSKIGIVDRNILLDHLPRDVRERIQKDLVPVSLSHGEIIHKPGDKVRDLYFPLTCMISVTVTMRDGRTIETGAIGSREVVGINAFMGARETTQTEYIVQLPGDALRIATEPLKTEFDRNSEMRDVMLSYTQAFIAQISQNVACNRLHEVDERFARWLLEVQDRVRAVEFPLSHEFIAQMLGIRRSGVTDAAMKLKKEVLLTKLEEELKLTICRHYRSNHASATFPLKRNTTVCSISSRIIPAYPIENFGDNPPVAIDLN